MDFIKRHYEKLLLLAMLVLFIGIMVYVVSVADKAGKVKQEELEFNPKDLTKNMVTQLQSTDPQFSIDTVLKEGMSDWNASHQREKFAKGNVPGTFSDLVVAMRIASCPHCKAYIPRYYFRSDFKCPSCAEKLADIPLRPKTRRRVITENDLDGDGMPNSYETSKGLDPNSADDQLTDKDGDGFSNLFEYENGTDPVVKKSCPPLWYRLRYGKMESVVLPVRLNSISDLKSKDKKKWFLQIKILDVDRSGMLKMDKNNNYIGEDRDFHLGDTITIEDRIYRIEDANYKISTVGGNKVDDQSSVTLVQQVDKGVKIKPDVLTLRVDKEVRSNDKRLIIEDVGYPILNDGKGLKENGRPCYAVRIGHPIELGIGRARRERYRLVSVNEEEKTALFARPDVTKGDPTKDINGKKILVTQHSEIPEDLQVKKVVRRSTKVKGVQNRSSR